MNLSADFREFQIDPWAYLVKHLVGRVNLVISEHTPPDSCYVSRAMDPTKFNVIVHEDFLVAAKAILERDHPRIFTREEVGAVIVCLTMKGDV